MHLHFQNATVLSKKCHLETRKDLFPLLGEIYSHCLGKSQMRNHVVFIILSLLSKKYTCCHLKISHNNFSLKLQRARHALQGNHTWKGLFTCSQGDYRWRREKYPALRGSGAVQKSVENDRGTQGCGALPPSALSVWTEGRHLLPAWLSFGLRCQKSASQWKSMSTEERGNLPSVPLGTCCHLVWGLDV